MTRKRVGVLISGRGSNLKALVAACGASDYPAEIIVVVSNRPDAVGLDFAKSHGIATEVIDHRNYASREAFDAAVDAYLESMHLDIICCAGFMRIMTPVLIKPWAGRMLNIHPSLLPDYKGLHTHRRALADGASHVGCSVHIVNEELDGGPVLGQAAVKVRPGDTPETLQERVLVQEHRLYPYILRQLALGNVFSDTALVVESH